MRLARHRISGTAPIRKRHETRPVLRRSKPLKSEAPPRLVDLARGPRRRKLRLTYLPFCADDSKRFFLRSVRRYRRFGVEEFCCLEADRAPSRRQIAAALDTDIVYLAGGNTFYFLKHLRESGILPELKKFARDGGVIAGTLRRRAYFNPERRTRGRKRSRTG